MARDTDRVRIAHRDMIFMNSVFNNALREGLPISEEDADDLRGRLEYIIETFKQD